MSSEFVIPNGVCEVGISPDLTWKFAFRLGENTKKFAFIPER